MHPSPCTIDRPAKTELGGPLQTCPCLHSLVAQEAAHRHYSTTTTLGHYTHIFIWAPPGEKAPHLGPTQHAGMRTPRTSMGNAY